MNESFWNIFKRHKLGTFGFIVIIFYLILGIYAPFFASGKPIFVLYHGKPYFPLFEYLFYPGYFSKRIDRFFNLLMFTFPLFVLALILFRQNKKKLVISLSLLVCLQFFIFSLIEFFPKKDPEFSYTLVQMRQEALKSEKNLTWKFDLITMTDLAKLNLLLESERDKAQHQRIKDYSEEDKIPTLWNRERLNELKKITRLEDNLKQHADTETDLSYILDKKTWLEKESKHVSLAIYPMLRDFHWEEDAGGSQSLNRTLPWWELSRINRKDLVAALMFGIRISFVVGILAISVALVIGIPIGAIAGFYGGRWDIVISRILEVWEGMPTFFMLLMVVAILQSKSIFLVITIIGFFGWTGISRYIRAEFLKQRNLPYVEGSYALGYSYHRIMFLEILPNAIPPILTLLPFSIMGAITSEAGLSFLGLGEEGSCSWGVLMDEGRQAFPGESYLLWPPAIMLTILLIAIALVGDALRDALDPKLRVR